MNLYLLFINFLKNWICFCFFFIFLKNFFWAFWFKVYEKFDARNSDRYEFILPDYTLNKTINTNDKLNGSLTFDSTGSQHIFNTNVYEAQIVNDLLYKSKDQYLDSGIKNNYNFLLKNVNTDGSNSTTIANDLKAEMLSSFIFESSYPLLREGINFNNYLSPKMSFRYSPNKMKNLKDQDRRISINNIYSLDRIGYANTVESGQSLTVGGEYKNYIKKDDSIKDLFHLSLATVFRDKIEEDIPISSSLGNKSSNVVGNLKIWPASFFNTSYNFSVDNNIDEFKTDFSIYGYLHNLSQNTKIEYVYNNKLVSNIIENNNNTYSIVVLSSIL